MKLILTAALTAAMLSGAAQADDALVSKGKELAFSRSAGNCLACHAIDDGTLAGNQGPALIAMQARFPDQAVLKAQIYDATVRNPATSMPPFGRNHILTDEQIDAIVAYLYTL